MSDKPPMRTDCSDHATPLPTLRGKPAEPPPAPLELRAGPLALTFAEGGLRYVRAGADEIASQIYVAIRDENWETVPGRLREVTRDVRQDSFEVSFTSEHRLGDIAFFWRGCITGHASGVLEFVFDGEAVSTFRRNRIGFCVLHPATLAGSSYRAEHTDGTVSSGTFPTDISAHQPVYALRALRHALTPTSEVTLRFEGDTFEMEDQRNWTDASFKTYCTPLAEPYPVTMTKGERVRQKVSLQVFGSIPEGAAKRDLPMIAIDMQNLVSLPELGLAANKTKLSEGQLERLSALNLTHLRLDLDLKADYTRLLEQTTEAALALGVKLEVALQLSRNAETELSQVLEQVRVLTPPLGRWLIFAKNTKCTPVRLLDGTRSVLSAYRADVPVGGGTDAFFAELNREFPPAQAFDFISYSVNPQVHAFDDASLVETLPVQGVTVDSARKLSSGKPVVVSPITLKMRWNPNATVPTSEKSVLADRVDQRQWSLFNAGWTLGSIKYLAQHGGASLTYFETCGALGVMSGGVETPSEALLPPPGCVYPVYHVFADVGAFSGGQVYLSSSSHPRAVESLVLERMGKIGVLLANHTPDTLRVDITGLTGKFVCRLLDEGNVLAAMLEPEAFRAQTGTLLELPGTLSLPPYAYARLESGA